MNKTLKKMLSCLMALAISMPLAGTAFAATDTAGASEAVPAAAAATDRTLSIDFLGRGSAPQDTDQGLAQMKEADATAQVQFWVGVAVDNVHDLDLFYDGVYSLEIAFEYDSSFVVPYYTGNDMDGTWNQALVGGNLGAANSSTLWNELQYEIISETEAPIDAVNDRENKTEAAARAATNTWKMCTVGVNIKDDASAADSRFSGLASADKQYLLRFPFKLLRAPTASDADQNPTVLSLVLGPETFNIGSGEVGVKPKTAWRYTVDDPTDATNAKTLFTNYTTYINLFGSGGAVENIIALKPMSGTETADTPYTLWQDKLQLATGFNPAHEDYYLSVPNEISTLKMEITSTQPPTLVQANGGTLSAPLSGDKKYTTTAFVLNLVDKSTEPDGFNNTVVIEVGGLTYTVYIRRLWKPRIELNYGNSPAGEIWNDDTGIFTDSTGVLTDDQVKENAVTAFNMSDTMYKTYAAGQVPARGQTDLPYVAQAWAYYTDDEGNMINYDLDKYALFVYQGSVFKEPGCVVYDEMNEPVADAVVTKTLPVKRQTNSGPMDYTSDAGYTDYSPVQAADGTYSLSGIMVRTDRYWMTYSYEGCDDVIRPVIILGMRGDVALYTTPGVGTDDVNYFRANQQFINIDDRRSLMAYRCLNFTGTGTPGVGTDDVNILRTDQQILTTSTLQYYKALP